mgnify:CR=1 FL=1
MLFKLSLSNIRKSLRDYAIYFVTLVIGVSVFYVFNAIGDQTVYMQVSENRDDIIELLTNTLSGISVFVAVLLGLIIVYANRFLMKRRNMEFALYLMLGMGKGRISAILFVETLTVGIGSIVVGLLIGIGLSQLMSVLVANFFEADMSSYSFCISNEAIIKTILYFLVMYIVVIFFNSITINHFKLIDLIRSRKKSEKIRLKNPILCILIFIVSAAVLAYAYYRVCDVDAIADSNITIYIALGIITTFFIFWSISGLFLRMIMSMKNMYYKGLNCFTFRQISSKVNTAVMSMTVICIMLFVTICTLSSAFSIKNSMNANLNELCPADFEIEYQKFSDEEKKKPIPTDIMEVYDHYGYDITEDFEEYVHFSSYMDSNFTFEKALGEHYQEAKDSSPYAMFDVPESIVKVSDYNELMKLYGREPITLQSDEFVIIGNFQTAVSIRDKYLEKGDEINIFGHTLKSKYDSCQDGFISISSQPLNAGTFIVSDDVVDESGVECDYFIGNYNADTKEGKTEIEKELKGISENVVKHMNDSGNYSINFDTKIEIAEATVGLSAMIAFIGLYIGIIFLISCAAIIALKQLSESVDNISQYEMLRKIGVEESDISKSLFRQTGIFFLMPLLLACVHSIFGMKFSMFILEIFGTGKLIESVASTSIIILLIYGIYFFVTYFCSKGIIRGKK